MQATKNKAQKFDTLQRFEPCSAIHAINVPCALAAQLA
jgi:hypothetical protein